MRDGSYCMDPHAYAEQIVSNSRPLNPSDLTCPLVSVSYRSGAAPPQRDSEYIKCLLAAIRDGKIRPTHPLLPERGPPFQCTINVESAIRLTGGKAVVGYSAMATKGMRGIDLSAHVVWENQGLLIETTSGYEEFPFIPFPDAEPHNAEVIRLWPDRHSYASWAQHGLANQLVPSGRFIIELGPVPLAENQNGKRFKVRKKVRR